MIQQQSTDRRRVGRFARSGLYGILITGVLASMACGTQPAANIGSDGSVEVVRKATSDTGVAPDFVAMALDGAEFSLSETAGQVRLIDFWATWCAPCREEIPMLVKLDKTYGHQGLTILAISDEDAEVVRDFVEDNGVTYTNLVDTGEISEDYLVLGLPTGFLIDREGNIVERFTGPKPSRILEKRIRELLELPPA